MRNQRWYRGTAVGGTESLVHPVRTGRRNGLVDRPALSGLSPAPAVPFSHESLEVRKAALYLAALLVIVLAIRIHEAVPLLAKLRPALLLSFLAVPFALVRTPKAVFSELIQKPLARYMLAYAALAVATVPFSLWPGQSATSARGLGIGVALAFVIAASPATERAITFLETSLGVGAAAYAIALIQTGVPGPDGRLSLPWGTLDSNDVAAMMAVAFPIIAARIVTRNGWQRLLSIGLVVTLMLAIIATRSRGGTLGLVAGAAIMVAGLKGGRRWGALFLLVAGFGAAWYFAGNDFRERMLTLGSLNEDYNTYSYVGRQAIWERGIGYMLSNPLLGVGIGAFPVAEGQALADMGLVGKWSAAHNAFVQAGAEMGVGGLALLVAMIVLVGKTVIRWRNGPSGAGGARQEYIASIVAFSISAIFLSHAYSYLLFVIIGLTLLVDRRNARFRTGAEG